MVDTKNLGEPNPWMPITDILDLAHLGKLLEEINELGSAAARCQIQGLDEREPTTGKLNRDWLRDEISDVIANVNLCIEHFALPQAAIIQRVARKTEHLRAWHAMLKVDNVIG